MMIVDLERTCTPIPRSADPSRAAVSRLLSKYRSTPAYVLLGDPGAGKTTSFRRERDHTPNAIDKVIDARDFVTLEVANHPEWHDRILFIDGLDEIRAGNDDGRTALDRVRTRLDKLRPPGFRLSCREADWLGPNDWTRLETVAPEGQLAVLRLDALTLDDARRIVQSSELVEDAGSFLQEANDRGLQELLLNPQTLELLVKAVGGAGQWPESRLETFELACRQLTKEKNKEHRYSQRDLLGEDEVLNDAGRICALLLLSGTPGVSLLPPAEERQTDHPQVEQLDPAPKGGAPSESEARARRRRSSLSSRLFTVVADSYSAGQGFRPVHRHIAEFLAGRYLAQQIKDGLPAARVLALITGLDGGVVTAHRGLSGWLAAHSKPTRQRLIDSDPIGVGLYGDITSFSTREKRALLRALLRVGPKLQDLHWRNVDAFVPIATRTLEEEIRNELTTDPQDEDNQHSRAFLLMLLSNAPPMTTLAGPILAILSGSAWWYRVRYWALDAFLRHCSDEDRRLGELERLLSGVYSGHLRDPDNRIAGAALEQLYPSVVGPAEVWRYLTRTRPSNYLGNHWLFWTRLAEEERSSDTDVAVLLDALPTHLTGLRTVLDSSRLATVAAQLLARGLDTLGAKLTPPRLYDWLSAPVQCQSYAPTQEAEELHGRIAAWLEDNPDAYKCAFREGLRRGQDDDPPSRVVRVTRQRLYEARPPADFDSWCLGEAETFADTRPALAQWLFRHALTRFNRGQADVSRERLDDCVLRHPSWQPEPADPKLEKEIQVAERRWKASKKALEEEQEQQHRQWLDAVRQEALALRENRGAPWLLGRLASRWFERPSREEISLQDWLREELDHNEALAAAAFQGLQGVVDRDDMPGPDEILNLHSESRRHWLSLPFLATLHDRDQETPTFIDHLTTRQQRQALALHYCVPTMWGQPAWYDRLIQQAPDVAASVLLPFARAEIRAGRNHVPGLSELAHDPHHAELARLVSLPLLRGFPVRSRTRQLPDLNRLLWAALKHGDREELCAIIAQKVAARSITPAQRVTWLGAGLVVDPQIYSEPLEAFVDGIEQRAKRLAEFLWFDFIQGPSELPPRALEALIRQFGRAGIDENNIRDSPDPSPGRMGGLIELLAASSEPEAAEALRRLATDGSLSEWRPASLVAIDRQTVVSRDASYERPELAAIRATLDNAAPANAADLAALALDRLDEMAGAIRHTSTNDWRQYWNEDTKTRQPVSPKHEESCRDTLLSRLRFLLREELHDQPEAAAAANKRADIGLFGPSFHVPIEVKKQSNPKLWRAVRDQLVAKYTQDPATGGYGIYLVLWFGDPRKTPLDETGTRPHTPEELRLRLETGVNAQLPHELARKIAVRVIDVSKP